jgi:SAM-dependent methyltransferase
VSATLRNRGKRLLRRAVPLSLRKRLAVAIERQLWIDAERRRWWSVELVRDLVESNADGFHRFLWANHLAYAATYETALRFGPENLKLSRQMFFEDLMNVTAAPSSPVNGVSSVLEVGCSLGYQLRHIEQAVFPKAAVLEGFDIDRYAIECGSEYLNGVSSKVVLRCDDVDSLRRFDANASYDVVICTGVLMYLHEAAAATAIAAMLGLGKIVALSGLASATDNAELAHSGVRHRDGTFIHNFDRMVKDAGGRVLARRWEGDRDFEGNTVYFVFATGARFS